MIVILDHASTAVGCLAVSGFVNCCVYRSRSIYVKRSFENVSSTNKMLAKKKNLLGIVVCPLDLNCVVM